MCHCHFCRTEWKRCSGFLWSLRTPCFSGSRNPSPLRDECPPGTQLNCWGGSEPAEALLHKTGCRGLTFVPGNLRTQHGLSVSPVVTGTGHIRLQSLWWRCWPEFLFQRTSLQVPFTLLRQSVISRLSLWLQDRRRRLVRPGSHPQGGRGPHVYLQTARLAGKKWVLAVEKQTTCFMRILSVDQELRTGDRCWCSLCLTVLTLPVLVSSASLSQENQRKLARKWRSSQCSPWLGSSPGSGYNC